MTFRYLGSIILNPSLFFGVGCQILLELIDSSLLQIGETVRKG